ncbi:MAG: Sec-independent protein translocase protein TatB [Burkholderiales bacterium]|nr:Sec-independent protein translocase protein TatB [Burkholderiales bacterium]
MIDLGISKMALIGAVALVVIGPEKLPGLARMLGAFIGKAQRYVSDVKAEVNRSMDLEELKKMKDSVESAAQEVQNSVQTSSNEFEKEWADTTAQLTGDSWAANVTTPVPQYQNPQKKWRLKRGTTPHWYKARMGVRTKALSGAARVARFRPGVKPNV